MINYGRIQNAIDFYQKLGYQYLDVPWLVKKESVDVTKPPTARNYETFAGCLVASGEQSFYEIRHDLCPSRFYQCVTPCFRDEKYDELHLPYFLKNELIVVLWRGDSAEVIMDKMIHDAFQFFSRYCYGGISEVHTDIGTDLAFHGIELGSYGVRDIDGFRWVYGTGCAEPRLSQAIALGEKIAAQELDDLVTNSTI